LIPLSDLIQFVDIAKIIFKLLISRYYSHTFRAR